MMEFSTLSIAWELPVWGLIQSFTEALPHEISKNMDNFIWMILDELLMLMEQIQKLFTNRIKFIKKSQESIDYLLYLQTY